MKGEGGEKMSNADVLAWYANFINDNEEHAELLLDSLLRHMPILSDELPWRAVFVHAILDEYRMLKNVPDNDLLKTALRQLIKRYMSGSTGTVPENAWYKGFCDWANKPNALQYNIVAAASMTDTTTPTNSNQEKDDNVPY
jgi:hypothetical protein